MSGMRMKVGTEFRELLASAPDAVIIVNSAGQIVLVSTQAEKLFGYPRKELLGQPVEILMPDRFRRPHVGHRLGYCADPRTRVMGTGLNLFARRKDGSEFPVEIGLSPMGTKDERLIISIIRDITDHRRMEEALRRAHDELEIRVQERTAALAQANEELQKERDRAQKYLDIAGVILLALDGRGEITLINQQGCGILGYEEGELIGKNWFDTCLPVQIREEVRHVFQELMTGEPYAHCENPVLTKWGEERMIAWRNTVLTDEAGNAIGTLSSGEDVTERKRAEEARLQLLQRLVTAQEEERRRVSRELHDQLGQHLSALLLGLKALEIYCQSLPSAGERIRQLQELTDQLMQEVHRLAWELRPAALDDWGLHIILRRYVEEWSQRCGVSVDFYCSGLHEQRLPSHIETTLYRVVQEALTNVFRHAQANRVSVLLERRRNHVLAIVEDDGQGFDAEVVMGAPDAQGNLGLLGMQERVALVGGTLEIESTPGTGTTVFVRIPLSNQ